MWVNTEICMTNILFKIQGNLKNTNHDRWHLYICTQNTQLHESNNNIDIDITSTWNSQFCMWNFSKASSTYMLCTCINIAYVHEQAFVIVASDHVTVYIDKFTILII